MSFFSKNDMCTCRCVARLALGIVALLGAFPLQNAAASTPSPFSPPAAYSENDLLENAVTELSEASGAAEITTPAPGSTLTSTIVIFSWNSGTGVSQYWLSVGRSAGSSDLYGADQGIRLSRGVAGLPNNGSLIYVRLWSLISGTWAYNDYTFATCTGCGTGTALAQIVSPAPDSTFTSTAVTFIWNAGASANQYWLTVGTSTGGGDIYNADQGTSLTGTVYGFPNDGRMVYARLWSLISGTWLYNDSKYQTCSNCGAGSFAAQITSPVPGSTLTSTAVVFNWSMGTGVSQYWLQVGTIAGGKQLYDKDQGKQLSVNIPGLPNDGRTIYTRLWSLVSGVWIFNDASFLTCNGCSSGSTLAEITIPEPGSTLNTATVMFNWTAGTAVTSYALSVGKTAGGQEIYGQEMGTRQSARVTAMPTDGSTIYVRLSSFTTGKWLNKDYTYKSCNGCAAPAEIAAPAPGQPLPGSTVMFAWDAGAGVSQYKLQVGRTPGGQEYLSAQGAALARTVLGLPTDGSPVYVRLSSFVPVLIDLQNGQYYWASKDYVYMACSACSNQAEIVSPTPGQVLISTTVTFIWSEGSGASQFWLTVGRTAGGKEIYDGNQGSNLSKTITGLPADGKPVYVRIWSLTGGVWKYSDYIYLATPVDLAPGF